MNRQQFVKHVESTQRPLRRFLTALCCGDSPLADDIAQDAYIKAYLSCEEIRDENKFSAWIFRIAYNSFISHCRSRKPTADIDEAIQLKGSDRADSSFRYQELYTALDKLSEKERTSILLFYLQGYSIKEIAEIIESSPEAVKQQLSRGRNHLRDLLENI